MIKSNTVIILLICLVATSPTTHLQARSIPAILVGSALATAGMAYTSMASGFFFEAKTKEDHNRLGKHMLQGMGATFVGLCLLGYGASPSSLR